MQRAGQNLPLVASPDPIVLGAGGQATFAICNVRAQPITIKRIEVTCPCVRVGPLPVRIGSGETSVLHAAFEPKADDAEFEGRLLVGITGYSSDAAIVFQTRAQIDSDTQDLDFPR